MAKLAVAVPHELTQEEATKRLEEGLKAIKEQHGSQLQHFEEQRDGNTASFQFKAMGFSVSGKVVVEPSEVRVDAQLPMAAALFKGTIEQQLRSELGRMLA